MERNNFFKREASNRLWRKYLHVIKFSQLLNFFFQTLLRNYETDIEQLNKQQKLQVEKAEVAQGLDMKLASKKLKADQVLSRQQTWNHSYQLGIILMNQYI